MLTDAEIAALVAGAESARKSAHAPYSGFPVGAAVVSNDDRVFFGCNVENASYGLSLCAERSAIATAVANGVRRIRAIVVVTGSDPPGTPCGACRQWLAEFGDEDMEVIAANSCGCVRRFSLGELLPAAFRFEKS